MLVHRPAIQLPAALLLAVFAFPAMAKMDPALEQRYAGVYGNACQDMRALRVRFWGDEMHVEAAGRDVVAHRVRGSKTHPGVSAPDFVHAFTGDVKGADTLTFVLFHNKEGLFARIEAGPKTAAMIGPALGQRLRHCDPNRNHLPGQAPPPPLGPTDLLKDAKFKAAYFSALGPLSRERWLAQLDGPAPEVKTIKALGADYQLVSVCKPHDCAQHNLVVLWSAATGTLYGKVYQAGRGTLLGRPPSRGVPEIERIWKGEWRK
jgi:hypothetical protein